MSLDQRMCHIPDCSAPVNGNALVIGLPYRIDIQLPRALVMPSKHQRSRARSGRLQRWVRRTGRRHSPAPRMRPTPARNHAARRACGGTTPARNHASTTGVRLEPPAARNHARHDGRTAPRAVVPHLHHALPAPRAVVPHQYNERLHDGNRHHGRSQIAPDDTKKACRPRSPAAERPAHQPPRAPSVLR